MGSYYYKGTLLHACDPSKGRLKQEEPELMRTYLKKRGGRAGKTVQWLRTLAVLAEVPVSMRRVIPSIGMHIVYIHTCRLNT